MVEKIMRHVYPDNVDKLIINALIKDNKIDLSKVTDTDSESMYTIRLAELEILEYVTSATVGADSHLEYYPSQKFLDELKVNNDEFARLDAEALAREEAEHIEQEDNGGQNTNG